MDVPEETALPPLRFVIGPTAAGKSALALALAERTGAAIVSMDSMQVYRGMDVGTAKPTSEERARVPHFGLDLVDPSERYDVQRFLADTQRALEELERQGRPALLVGGTGFYLQALLRGVFQGPAPDPALRARLQERAREGGSPVLHAELTRLDPPSAERIHPNDEKRVVRALEVLEQTGKPLSSWQREWGWHEHGETRASRAHRIVGLTLETERLDQRIHARARAMLAAGWADEARAIRDGCGFGPTAIQALGYREVLDWVDGRETQEAVLERIALRTRQFARRQRTWFRRFESTTWLEAEAHDPEQRLATAERVLFGEP